MKIKRKLTKKDYINACVVLLYTKPAVRVITALFSLAFPAALLVAIFIPKASFATAILPLVMIVYYPVITYFAAMRNYSTNLRISELIEYDFERDYLVAKGESFNYQYTWNKVYKVVETNNWIFIFQNKQNADCIPKRNFTGTELNQLRMILQAHAVRNNL